MKAGDTVRLSGDGYLIQQVWIVTNIKSDSRGLWLQLDDSRHGPDVWHSAKYFEVVNESR